MMVPEWWIAVSVACFTVVTLVVVGLLVALTRLANKTSLLVRELSVSGAPVKLAILTEQVNAIGAKVDDIVARVDRGSHTALPRMETLIDRVDRTVGMVESGRERVSHVIEGTAEGIHRMRRSPLARTVLFGAGSLAALRFVREALQRYARANGDGRVPEHAEQPLVHGMEAGRTVMELPQRR